MCMFSSGLECFLFFFTTPEEKVQGIRLRLSSILTVTDFKQLLLYLSKGETLEVEIFFDSEDELRNEPEDVKEEYRQRKKKEQEEALKQEIESDKKGK